MKTTNEQNQQSEALYLEMAIDTIRLNAIKNKVKAIGANSAQTSTAVIRTMSPYRMTLRIAAALLIMLCSATIYKYTSVSSQTFYDQQFAGYEMRASRDASFVDAQVEAYQSRNWNQVIALNQGVITPTNKANFLSAMARMELKQFPDALQLFQAILANHSDDSFREEADYYMALAYLANHQEQEGLNKIAQIKANPDHTYYPVVNQISPVDLKIISFRKN